MSSDHQCALFFILLSYFLIHVNVELLVVRIESQAFKPIELDMFDQSNCVF